MLHTTKTFQVNSSIYFDCEFYNLSYVPTDPTDLTWTIKDNQGNTVETGGPTKQDTGIWYFFYVPTVVGDYTLTWSGKIDEKQVSIKKRFKVVDITLR